MCVCVCVCVCVVSSVRYVGIPKDHPQSYHHFMWTNFFKHVDITPANVHILDGNAPDLQMECEKYEQAIEDVG